MESMRQSSDRRLLRLSYGITAGYAILGITLVAIATLWLDPPRDRRETITLFDNELRPSWIPISWGTAVTPRAGGLRIVPHLAGRPWVGFRLQRTRRDADRDPLRPVLDQEWLRRGVLRFSLRGGSDSSGVIHPPPRLQLFLHVNPTDRAGRAVRLRPWHCMAGRWDRDPGSWKEAVVPLSLFACPAGTRLFGIAFQVVGELHQTFDVTEIHLSIWDEESIERFATPTPGVAAFPALVELPAELREPPAPAPVLDRGTVLINGTARFLLGAQFAYDPRVDLWGDTSPPHTTGKTWPGYPSELAWLYEAIPSYEQFTRVGLNSWAVFVPPEPFLERYLPQPLPQREGFDPSHVADLAIRMRVPPIADFTAFRWTVGALRAPGILPPRALAPPHNHHRARSHNMPFSLLPEGRALYREYFERVAAFLKEKNVKVFQFELFNEPDYPPGDALDRESFARFLRERFPDHGEVARLCGLPAPPHGPEETEEVYHRASRLRPEKNLLLWHAHGEYLSGLFLQLVGEAMDSVRSAYNGTDLLFSVQLNTPHAVQGTPLIDPERLYDLLPIIASPTDGGVWTFGSAADSRPSRMIESPLAPAPITADLLQTFAGGVKPVFDHEMNAPGSAEALRRALWTRVLLGFDGVWLFSWSKRAYEWTDEDRGKRSATSYTLLNPYAHPPAALAALWRFRRELAPHEELLLPKPFGPRPCLGFLHSFANEAAHTITPTARELGRAAYACLRYSHLPLRILTERMVRAGGAADAGLKALVLAGCTVMERTTIPALRAYVEGGGIIILVNSPLEADTAGRPLRAPWLTDSMGDEPDRSEVALAGVPEEGLPGNILGYGFRRLRTASAEVIFTDRGNTPRVVCRPVGDGRVYTISFEGRSYAILRVLLALLRREGITAPWRLTMEDSGEHAVNVLMSVRRRNRVQAVLLANQDLYGKRVRFRWPDLRGLWRATLHLGNRGDAQGADTVTGPDGIACDLPAEGVRLIVLQRAEIDQSGSRAPGEKP